MRTAVLGATGSIGTLVVDRLLANGHVVAAVSRSAMRDREPDARLFPRVGNLTDAGFLREALAGCDAVISCLGQNRASKSLFAKRTSPPDILRRVAAATVAAIGDGGQHLVYVSAFGVGADRKRHALPFRIVLRLSSIHAAYLDHDVAEGAIRASRATWTVVRPPGLTDKDEEVPLVAKERWSSFETASKRSVAAFLVRCVEERSFLEQTVTIGEPSRR